jgi:hypothetical protein
LILSHWQVNISKLAEKPFDEQYFRIKTSADGSAYVVVSAVGASIGELRAIGMTADACTDSNDSPIVCTSNFGGSCTTYDPDDTPVTCAAWIVTAIDGDSITVTSGTMDDLQTVWTDKNCATNSCSLTLQSPV